MLSLASTLRGITADKLVQLKQACSCTGDPMEASINLGDLLGVAVDKDNNANEAGSVISQDWHWH